MMERDVLNMSLKKPFYDEIERGVKKVEYRTMSDYWIGKLVDKAFYKNMDAGEIRKALTMGKMPLKWVKWKNIRFWHDGSNMLVEIKDIKVYEHHSTFAISLGKIKEINNKKD